MHAVVYVTSGETFTCTAEELDAAGVCVLSTGDAVLQLYGMTEASHFVYYLWLLGLISVVYFALALVVFRIRGYLLSH